MGRSRYRVLKHDVGVKWDPRRTAAYVPSHFMVLNPIFCYVSPKIVIFHEPLIVETRNKCHWIQHALNPKYAPLKQFWCIFPVQINKMWNFCLKWCEPLITENWFSGTTYHRDLKSTAWIQLATNPKYMTLKPFWCIFLSQNQQNVKFWLISLTIILTKNLKKCQFTQGKSFCKGLQICTYRFLGMLHFCPVRTLCNNNTFWQLLFSAMGRSRLGFWQKTWCRGKSLGPKYLHMSHPISWFWTAFLLWEVS